MELVFAEDLLSIGENMEMLAAGRGADHAAAAVWQQEAEATEARIDTGGSDRSVTAGSTTLPYRGQAGMFADSSAG